MINQSNLKRETRYGIPAADQILFNRHYVLGYSYYFRQAKWALEIVDKDRTDVERLDNFRPDYRIPERFRADLADYTNSGFDRGHLVSSANQIETQIQNSETFLLSNMSPQNPKFNRGIWKKLEAAIRTLNSKKNILETYVISGPLFMFDTEVKVVASKKETGVTLPIPHSYFKSILTENHRGALHLWSFIIPNEETDEKLETFQVATSKIEKISGLFLWESLVGTKVTRDKNKVRKIWKYE
ncbi:DNA/RNA non-specific endonuclease [Polaribacter sp. Hel1_85]|uniref:DNA/RNA non-specific endonuclease n=1 Tax=Polaribacter sp. Hel1_85 TaxID=1250005 RepID=UPI00052BA190|nr:DNA/RNA non-specific endonuclease [Polaribacter sp. Hel1_85]KGL63793.1 DNA/RNA non-specific endonuclease precursor [Polaribacter sp. Hel1_85]